MGDLFASADLVFVPRTGYLDNFLSGQRWEVTNRACGLIAVVAETDLTTSRRLGRLLTSRLQRDVHRRLTVHDPAGTELFTIVRIPPTLRRDDTEIRAPDGQLAGTVSRMRLANDAGLGYGLLDPDNRNLATVRRIRRGPARYEVVAPDQGQLATFDDLTEDGTGYRLHVTQRPTDRVEPLLFAAPLVRYFFHQP